MPPPPDPQDDLSDVLEQLYGAPPDDFVRIRSELAAAARDVDDRDRAKRIAALRKPTVAASVVNRQALADPDVIETLTNIGDRLRAAQGSADGIDRDLLRDLSLERRSVVHDVSERALDRYAPSAGQSVRDEVAATVDAAVADPEVAARLGRLTHAEQWSGLGVVAQPGPTGRADLTVVRGGKAAARTAARPPARSRSALAAADARLAEARAAADAAEAQAGSARARVDELSAELERIDRSLTAARQDAADAVKAQRSARSTLREAQSARNRAARRSTD